MPTNSAMSTDQKPSQMVRGARVAMRSTTGRLLTTHAFPRSSVRKSVMKPTYCRQSGTSTYWTSPPTITRRSMPSRTAMRW